MTGMLDVYFASRTGNVRRFIGKAGVDATEIRKDTIAERPYILVTHTTGFGQVPPIVTHFLRNSSEYLAAVVVSGNRAWGENYGAAGATIAKEYDVPLLQRFEMAGLPSDVDEFKRRVDDYEKIYYAK